MDSHGRKSTRSIRGLTIQTTVQCIRLYRLLLSPFLGVHCRFYPSCSHYAETALREHGLVHGGLLAVRRLLRCHPWHEGGLDPVPSAKNIR